MARLRPRLFSFPMCFGIAAALTEPSFTGIAKGGNCNALFCGGRWRWVWSSGFSRSELAYWWGGQELLHPPRPRTLCRLKAGLQTFTVPFARAKPVRTGGVNEKNPLRRARFVTFGLELGPRVGRLRSPVLNWHLRLPSVAERIQQPWICRRP